MYTRGLKVGDKVFVLKHYDIEEATIEKFYEDYEHDESDHRVTWVETSKGDERLSDVCTSYKDAERSIEGKKKAYDNYVTRGW